MKARSGLDASEQFVVVQNGRLVAGAGWTQAPLDVPRGPSRHRLELNGERVRVLIADTPGSSATEPTLGVLSPQDSIDAATAGIQQRLLVGLLAALFLIALVAYLEGRSIVRTVSSIARAANSIARGKLDERVPVQGRDELAKLGNAFNQMADQLQQRLEELESERHRLNEAVSRFGDALAATHDVDQLMRAIVETAVEATGASGGMLVGSEGQVVEVGAPGTGSDQLELPLRAGQSTFGTLFLFGRNFDEDARLTAASLVAQSVIALDNAKLHRIVERQALVDGLTGLANRRQAEDALASEVSRAARFGGPALRRARRPRRLQVGQRRRTATRSATPSCASSRPCSPAPSATSTSRRGGAARSSCSCFRAPTRPAPSGSPSGSGTTSRAAPSSRPRASRCA